jgi:hypothetical protein
MNNLANGCLTPFHEASPDYHGVLSDWTSGRLVVSPNGKRYQVQSPSSAGYSVVRWRKSLALLLPDLPASVASWAADALPDDPLQFDRHWAAAMKTESDRFKRAISSSDIYSGVIASDGLLRLAISPTRRAYLVQQRGDFAWEGVASSTSTSRLLGLTYSRLSKTDKAFPLCHNRMLQNALLSLPLKARDYQGKMPERIADVRYALRATPHAKNAS